MRTERKAPKFDAVIRAPFGALGLTTTGSAVSRIWFLPPGTPLRAPADPILREAARQLEAYFADPHARFDLPLAPAGTDFQRRVWKSMTRIPVGRTRSYGEIAAELRSAAQAVGQACGSNPIPIVVPCHRVVSASGIGGFGGETGGYFLDVKRWLLAHEARASA
jgi:methylated-DNA-[protein]-cysteine S-methyltransferase